MIAQSAPAPTPAPAPAAPVRRLPGMRDLSDAACRRRQAVQRRLAGYIRQYGYQMLDAPALEPTELFLRKSGGALAARMYSFTDPGSNAVSLRPEFTASVMRHYLESAGESPGADAGAARSAVARRQYAGPVFRYDPDNVAASGQFTQIGAELIGVAGIDADAELLTLAAGAVASLGINDYRLRLADLAVLDSVLDTVGLSERARSLIVANMNRIGDSAGRADLLRRAAELRIVAGGDLLPEEANLAAAVAGLPDAEAKAVLAGFMRWRNAAAGATLGQRTPGEIIDRLLHKLRGGDDPDALRRGLALAGRLAGVSGAPADAVPRLQAVAADAGARPEAVNRLGELAALVAAEPVLRGHLVINFALARGIAYYNGIIFDLVAGGASRTGPAAAGVVLGGGGRYDGLARALGAARATPALGFACTLETLLDAMPSNAVLPDDAPADDAPAAATDRATNTDRE